MPEHPPQPKQFTAIIVRKDDGYVALCPELDVASQGDTTEEARQNLLEAVEAFLETADPSEIEDRLHSEVYVTRVGYRELAGDDEPDLDEVAKEFDETLATMQTSEAAAGFDALFEMEPEELGRAAVQGARDDDR